MTISVSVDDATGIAGGGLTLKYDPSVLRAIQVDPTDLIPRAISFSTNLALSGEVKIAMAGSSAIPSGSGALLTVTFDVLDDATPGDFPLELIQAEFANDQTQPIPVDNITHGTFEVSLGLRPEPIAGSGQISFTSDLPATTDQIQVSISGDFPTSAAAISSSGYSVSGEVITFDLVSRTVGDVGNTVITPWSIEETVEPLAAGSYEINANVNGKPFVAGQFSIGTPNSSPVSIDFDPDEGDQQKDKGWYADKDKVYQLQLYVTDAPEIDGWSITLEYDTTLVNFVDTSFTKGDFLANLIPLAFRKQGLLEIGGSVLGSNATNSGDGWLGSLSLQCTDLFEFDPCAAEPIETRIVITAVNFKLATGGEEKRVVRFVSTITGNREAPGDFDRDGEVDFEDFFRFADFRGTEVSYESCNVVYDLDGDGDIGFSDFFLFADDFGKKVRAKLIALAQQHIGLPLEPHLEQNYPNPFNSYTTIPYFVAGTEPVQLDIYSLTGQKIRTLVDRPQESGLYQVEWDGRSSDGAAVSTGVYLTRLQVGDFFQVQKMTLIK